MSVTTFCNFSVKNAAERLTTGKIENKNSHHKIYREEAVGLKSSNYTFKITIFSPDQLRKKLMWPIRQHELWKLFRIEQPQWFFFSVNFIYLYI